MPKTEAFVPWVNPYPTVHPSTSTEQILERIARAIEAMAEHQAGTNERLDSLREGLAILNVIVEEASNQ